MKPKHLYIIIIMCSVSVVIGIFSLILAMGMIITSNLYSTTAAPIGLLVDVKYNPDNPSDAIFVNDNSIFFVTLVGVIFTIAGAVFVSYGVKYKNRLKIIKNENI